MRMPGAVVDLDSERVHALMAFSSRQTAPIRWNVSTEYQLVARRRHAERRRRQNCNAGPDPSTFSQGLDQLLVGSVSRVCIGPANITRGPRSRRWRAIDDRFDDSIEARNEFLVTQIRKE